jgi:transposase
MTVYCGVDLHARKQTVSYCNTVEGEIHQVELHHQEKEQVREFYAQLKGEVIVGCEASGYSGWFEQLLAGLGHTLWVGNATEIRRLAPRRQKNDRRDADHILDLMLTGRFPHIQRQSQESRAVLRQLRYRHKLVKIRTMVKNSLQAISLDAGLSLQAKMFTRRGVERLQALELPAALATERDQWLQLVAIVNERVGTIDNWLETAASSDQLVELLRTHPGIGLKTALALRHTLSPVSRFTDTRKVTAYIGLDPMESSSADVKRMGAVSKAGSRLLRYLLGQAGHTACKKDPQLKGFYQRIRRRRDRPKAKVAVARKLLVRGFIMMRDEINYAEFTRRGVAARSSRLTHRP